MIPNAPAPRQARNRAHTWLAALLSLALLLVPWLGGTLAVRAGTTLPAVPPQGSEDTEVMTAGSYEVAPVRILGIPVIVVASPQLHARGNVVRARQRADLIENTLRMVYAPKTLCRASETLSEELLEGMVLGGPSSQRLCSSDIWAVMGRPDALVVERVPQDDASVLLQARLPGRPVPLPLLTVTAADAALRGQTPAQLAVDWQQLLQRRLRHARRTMQADSLGLRFWITLLVELGLFGLLLASVRVWMWCRQRERAWQDGQRPFARLRLLRPLQWLGLSRLLFALVILQLVIMLGVALAAVPGQIPLALDVLLLPLRILQQALVIGFCVWIGRLLLRFGLRQWGSSHSVPTDQRARREQRRRNLLQAGERLLNLIGLLLLLLLALTSIPGLSPSALGPWLAGGALLGTLAFVFQGLLRDFAAGLVTLLDDHYAVGDFVEIEGLSGEVEDIGVLATMLRSIEQRLVVIPNSRCDRLVNHTRLRSGVELVLPLSPAAPRLQQALELVRAECAAFAAEPAWRQKLLADPAVRGVRRVTPVAVELSVLVHTLAGQQGDVERELLGRLVRCCEREQLPLAQAIALPAASL